ncbi:hypothetical protein JCM11251_005206 [Rhodosporidiobolus azoricus]
MASLASSSRTLFRSASQWARTPTRTLATQAAPATTTTPLESSSSSASQPQTPRAAQQVPLPGSAVLPEAFRAPSASASAPSPSSSLPATPGLRSSSPSSAYSPRYPTRLTQPYKLNVYSTRNNTILTLSTSPSGAETPQAGDPHHPIAWVSAGSAGYKGAARGTYDAAVEVSLKMFTKVKNLIDPPVLSGGQRVKAAGPPPTSLEVVFKGFGKGRDAVFRTLMTAEGDVVRGLVTRVTDATPLKIGGTRPKKRLFKRYWVDGGDESEGTDVASRPRPFSLKKRNPTFSSLSDPSLLELVHLSNLDATLDWSDPKSELARLLVPRAVGSRNLTRVQGMVEDRFRGLGWHVEKDTFTGSTPIGEKTFTNLIFTHDPSAPRRLVLSAHIDSKYFPTHPQDQFIGATDSAAPCAMLIDLALALTPWLDKRKERIEAQGGEEGREGQGETLQIVFFDGEEAFKDWTSTDSIYGARHLVDKWSEVSESPSPTRSTPQSPLRRISHLILLDLLGAPNPLIRNFFPTTGWLFDEFLHAEQRLGQAGYLWRGLRDEAYTAAAAKVGGKERSFFVPRSGGNMQGYAGQIEDDHIPFLKKGVPIVHLISVPFPKVWHTIRDDASALDLPTIKAWALIVRLTVAEYLGLDPALEGVDEMSRRIKRDEGEL